MIFLLSAFLLLVSVNGQLRSSGSAKILRYDFQNDGLGSYYYNYASDDGINRQEEQKQQVSQYSNTEQVYVVKGSYSYTGPDGVVYTVRYTADENGFHPEGDHIKVPPYTPWPSFAKAKPEPEIDTSQSGGNPSVIKPGYNYPKPPSTAAPFDVEDLNSSGSEDDNKFAGYSYPKPRIPFVTGNRVARSRRAVVYYY